MIKEAKKLHDLGYALHWVKPYSKQPIGEGWTKGPRKTWAELEKSYRKGYNLGVRLGRASQLKNGFLAVIDCDVKSNLPKHRLEMETFVATLSIDPTTSLVWSGRGNGSRHLYITSEKPLQPFRLAQSSEKVRVRMPSVDATKKELSALSAEDLKAGYRIRPAWEISVMGEGQQVVLPPSLHPDTKEPYRWNNNQFTLPVRVTDSEITRYAKTATMAKTAPSQFTPAPLPALSTLGVPTEVEALIREGVGCEDRSASLYGVTIALVRAGLTDHQILTLLTDRNTFLGRTAYDHAKTRDRGRAAAWIKNFTLDKARNESSAKSDFASPPDERLLNPTEALAQFLDLVKPDTRSWEERLDRTEKEGRVKVTFRNIYRILLGEMGEKVFKRNVFANTEIYGCSTPWGGVEGAEVADIDTIRIKAWFAEKWGIEPDDNRINQAISKIADMNPFHPVRDYLDRLTWDGVPRIDTWLKTYLGGEAPEPYLSDVSRKVLCAMVARIYQPGIKYDCVLILEGKQGLKKSMALKALAGEEWFTDASLDIRNKDAALSLKSKWLFELGELKAVAHSDVNALKAFLSMSADYVRAPYGRRHESHPRQCVFVGSTNEQEYLKDTTGNRRFWPVSVSHILIEELEKDRDQLFAEAIVTWRLGEALYLDDPESDKQAGEEQGDRVFQDAWVDRIRDFLNNPNESFPKENFTIWDLFKDFGPLAGLPHNRSEQMRAADVLRSLGYTKKRVQEKNKGRFVFWSLKTPEKPHPDHTSKE